MKTVMVSGCFDVLHASHIAFLETAAKHGQLTVVVGTDENVKLLKGRPPMYPLSERLYRLNALSCVHAAKAATGHGMLDFEPEIRSLSPDVFVVAEDGTSQAKVTLCSQSNTEYVVVARGTTLGNAAQSSTDVRRQTKLPYRLCLAGGWMDQPWMSVRAPGSVVVAQLDPCDDYLDWSGMATSTRKTAQELWGERIPQASLEDTAKCLFACENPPGSKYLSGSQDAIGLVFPGVCRLDYSGEYWPARIQQDVSIDSAQWLERVVSLVPYKQRPAGYDPLLSQNLTHAAATKLADAGRMAWAAIVNQNIQGLAVAMNDTLIAWTQLLPLTVSPEMLEFRRAYSNHAGSCFSGAGGGYLMVVSDAAVKHSIPIHVRTSDW